MQSQSNLKCTTSFIFLFFICGIYTMTCFSSDFKCNSGGVSRFSRGDIWTMSDLRQQRNSSQALQETWVLLARVTLHCIALYITMKGDKGQVYNKVLLVLLSTAVLCLWGVGGHKNFNSQQ